MTIKPTVFEFIEGTKTLPTKISVERTQTSKYLFYSVVREYKRKLKLKSKFFVYQKSELDQVRSAMEEHSFLDPVSLFVLEGFSLEFFESLHLPEGSYCVAETDNGQITAPLYNYKLRRDILWLLLHQFGMRLSLRGLISLDWSMCREYADYEMMIRKAYLMGWNEVDIESQLKEFSSGQVLVLTKRGQFKDIFSMMEKYQSTWVQGHVVELLVQTTQYRNLKQMGYEDDKVARTMSVGMTKLRELEEISRFYTQEDLNKMALRMVEFDRLMDRNKDLAVSLYLLNAPVRLNR